MIPDRDFPPDRIADMQALRSFPELLQHCTVQEMKTKLVRAGLTECHNPGLYKRGPDGFRCVSCPDNVVVEVNILRQAGVPVFFTVQPLGTYDPPLPEANLRWRLTTMNQEPSLRALDDLLYTKTQEVQAWIKAILDDASAKT
jgi:hypothetical protein